MKTILVTGGNRGIGLEICRQLHLCGHRVIMGSRDLAKGKEAADKNNLDIIVRQLDVTDENSIRNLFLFLSSETGKLDVLINNAGISEFTEVQKSSLLRTSKLFLEKNIFGVRQINMKMIPFLRRVGMVKESPGASTTDILNVKKIMETNLYGPWRMSQVFIPLLEKSGKGRIINISSGMGELKSLNGYYPGYSMSKAGLNALTISLARELEKKRITVNAICPGWVKTEMGGVNATRSVKEGADTAVWLATEKEIPTGKFFRDRTEIEW